MSSVKDGTYTCTSVLGQNQEPRTPVSQFSKDLYRGWHLASGSSSCFCRHEGGSWLTLGDGSGLVLDTPR